MPPDKFAFSNKLYQFSLAIDAFLFPLAYQTLTSIPLHLRRKNRFYRVFGDKIRTSTIELFQEIFGILPSWANPKEIGFTNEFISHNYYQLLAMRGVDYLLISEEGELGDVINSLPNDMKALITHIRIVEREINNKRVDLLKNADGTVDLEIGLDAFKNIPQLSQQLQHLLSQYITANQFGGHFETNAANLDASL